MTFAYKIEHPSKAPEEMLPSSKDPVGEHIGANSEIYLDCILVNSIPQSHILYSMIIGLEEAVASSDCLDPGSRGRACNDLDASTRAQGSQEPSRSGIYGAVTRHVSVNSSQPNRTDALRAVVIRQTD
jgi:hypothetical protein